MIGVELFKNGPWQQNCYIVSSSQGKAVVIDPGSDVNGILKLLDKLSLEPLAIICTHAHVDHVGAVHELQSHFKIPFYLHERDHALLRRANLYGLIFDSKSPIKIPKECINLIDGEILQVDTIKMKILATPGHTEGSICIGIYDTLFTGDTIVGGKLGRADLPGGNKASLQNSVKKLMNQLPSKTICYPGHGVHFDLCSVEMPLQSGREINL